MSALADLLSRWDGLTKGESDTTRQVREAWEEDARAAAPFYGTAENNAYPVADRLACALQALKLLSPPEEP